MIPAIRRKTLPDLFDEFFGRENMSDFFDVEADHNLPAVNIIEGKDDFTIEVAAPGLTKKDFNIDLENNMLTISSEKKEEKKEDDKKFRRREFSYTAFKRSFTLPNSIEADKIKAKHDNGVLKIEIPKKEEAKEKPPRQIEIS